MNADQGRGDQETKERLRKLEGLIVQLSFSDGENTVAKLVYIDDECEDFVYDMVSTNRPDRHKDPEAAYAAPLQELLSFGLVDDTGAKAPA